MKKRNQRNLWITVSLLMVFVLWTAAISFIDVQAIGPRGSSVGFAALNGFFHSLTGTHLLLYTITDWLGLVPICFVLGFAVLGLVQLIKRRNLRKVDYDILVLGGFYILVMAAYMSFEMIIINYRPILIDGYLQASYPSSTTLLVMCVMPTVVVQFKKRITNKRLRTCMSYIIMAFTAFMIVGRLISGVHWFTDIVGGILLSGGLVMLYYSISSLKGELS